MAKVNQYQIMFTGECHAELVENPAESRYGNVPNMSIPMGPTEVAGETLYTLMSAGTEMAAYTGFYHKQNIPYGMFPFKPGYAACFRVDTVGEEVTDIKPGDICFCMGAHCSRQRKNRIDVIKVPEGMDPVKVPFARLMNVTMSTLSDSLAKPPAKVMVSGLGIVGVMGALAFQHCGYDVIAIDPIESRRKAAEECGIKKTFASAPFDDPDYGGQIALVVECSSMESAALDGVKMTRRGGEVILVGTQIEAHGDHQAHDLLQAIFRGNVSVRGGSEWRVPLHDVDPAKVTVNAGPQPLHYDWHNSSFTQMKYAMQWINEGAINVEPLMLIEDPANCTEVYEKARTRAYPKPAIIFDWSKING